MTKEELEYTKYRQNGEAKSGQALHVLVAGKEQSKVRPLHYVGPARKNSDGTYTFKNETFGAASGTVTRSQSPGSVANVEDLSEDEDENHSTEYYDSSDDGTINGEDDLEINDMQTDVHGYPEKIRELLLNRKKSLELREEELKHELLTRNSYSSWKEEDWSEMWDLWEEISDLDLDINLKQRVVTGENIHEWGFPVKRDIDSAFYIEKIKQEPPDPVPSCSCSYHPDTTPQHLLLQPAHRA